MLALAAGVRYLLCAQKQGREFRFLTNALVYSVDAGAAARAMTKVQIFI
jgi:hypothetical protein